MSYQPLKKFLDHVHGALNKAAFGDNGFSQTDIEYNGRAFLQTPLQVVMGDPTPWRNLQFDDNGKITDPRASYADLILLQSIGVYTLGKGRFFEGSVVGRIPGSQVSFSTLPQETRELLNQIDPSREDGYAQVGDVLNAVPERRFGIYVGVRSGKEILEWKLLRGDQFSRKNSIGKYNIPITSDQVLIQADRVLDEMLRGIE